jgi:hypothetical protein
MAILLVAFCAALAAGGGRRQHHVDVKGNKFGGKCREPICLARRKPSLNSDILSLDPTTLPQSLQEGFAPIGVVERCKAAAGRYTRSIVEIPDAPHFDRLLSVPQERPPRCCATEEDDEFSPSHADHGLPPSHASSRRS